MSKSPAKRSTSPPGMSQPRPIRTAATTVTASPVRVRALGVTPRRWMAVTNRRAAARTQAWNRWVNTSGSSARPSEEGVGPLACLRIDVQDGVADDPPVVAPRLLDPAPTHAAAQTGVGDQRLEGEGKAVRLARGHEQPISPRLDDVAESRDRRRHHRDPAGHRLEEDDAEAIAAMGRRAEDVGARVDAGEDVGRDLSEEADVGDPGRLALSFVRPAHRSVADDHQPAVVPALAELGVGLEEDGETLALLHPADEEDGRPAVGAQLGQRREVGPESPAVDAVGDDGVVPFEVAADEVPGRLAGRDQAGEATEVAGEEGGAGVVAEVGRR